MLRLDCTTTPEQIRDIADRVLAVAVERGAEQLYQSRILLALDEVLTNIRVYAYPDGPGPVQIEILSPGGDDDAVLHVRITDWGPPFDPLSDAALPTSLEDDLDIRPIGGLGLHLVRTLVHGLTYSREQEAPPSGGSNRLSVRFALR